MGMPDGPRMRESGGRGEKQHRKGERRKDGRG
jgi:hypothetical protein